MFNFFLAFFHGAQGGCRLRSSLITFNIFSTQAQRTRSSTPVSLFAISRQRDVRTTSKCSQQCRCRHHFYKETIKSVSLPAKLLFYPLWAHTWAFHVHQLATFDKWLHACTFPFLSFAIKCLVLNSSNFSPARFIRSTQPFTLFISKSLRELF